MGSQVHNLSATQKFGQGSKISQCSAHLSSSLSFPTFPMIASVEGTHSLSGDLLGIFSHGKQQRGDTVKKGERREEAKVHAHVQSASPARKNANRHIVSQMPSTIHQPGCDVRFYAQKNAWYHLESEKQGGIFRLVFVPIPPSIPHAFGTVSPLFV